MININARYVTQRLTGVQRYATEIVRFFPTDQVTLLCPRAMSSLDVEVTSRIRTLGRWQGHLWEQVELGSYARRSGHLLWSPCNVGPLLHSRQVVTIHDVFAVEYPEWVGRKFHRWYRVLLPQLARRAQHLLTVSEYSKRRIVEVLGVRPSKITVIPCGVGQQFRPAATFDRDRVRERYSLPEKYILTLGSIEPRKNLARTVVAWKKLPPNRPPLIIAGGLGKAEVFGTTSLTALHEEPGIRLLGYVPDEDLTALYSMAEVFVYAALMEGFGIPPLEAAACGVPVVTSNTSAFREHAAAYAALVNPYDVDSIRQGIERQLNHPPDSPQRYRWTRYIHEHYSWQSTSQAVWQVLHAHA